MKTRHSAEQIVGRLRQTPSGSDGRWNGCVAAWGTTGFGASGLSGPGPAAGHAAVSSEAGGCRLAGERQAGAPAVATGIPAGGAEAAETAAFAGHEREQLRAVSGHVSQPCVEL